MFVKEDEGLELFLNNFFFFCFIQPTKCFINGKLKVIKNRCANNSIKFFSYFLKFFLETQQFLESKGVWNELETKKRRRPNVR